MQMRISGIGQAAPIKFSIHRHEGLLVDLGRLNPEYVPWFQATLLVWMPLFFEKENIREKYFINALKVVLLYIPIFQSLREEYWNIFYC